MSLLRQSLRALKTASRAPIAARPAGAIRFASSAPPSNDDEVVIPEVHDTLEWVLSSPPPLHQFEEAPIVVETYGPIDPFH